jgi:glycosyltransferase involved in cell wall biosynthesis
MRVLLDALQAGNRSGTGRYTAELARWLPQLADDIEVTSWWPSDLELPCVKSESFRRCDVHGPLRRLYLDQIGIRNARAAIGADIVHYPASVGSLLPIKNAVVTIHDLSFLHEPRWFRPGHAAYYRFAVTRGAHTAARIIADSEATAADVRELLHIPGDRIDVIPLGVDPAYAPPSTEAVATAKIRYSLPERYMLYLGTLEPRKNVVRIIEAWSRVAGTLPEDLVIAGRDGWKVEPIHRAMATAPHAERIHRPGFIAHEDLPAVLGGATAFIWPSLFEGFGLPPLEAMACGVPVVTSNTSSLPEATGEAALTIDPLDTEALAQALKRLSEDTALRQTLREKGQARALQFTWPRTAQATLDTYRKTLA